jgi:hypothetical protein
MTFAILLILLLVIIMGITRYYLSGGRTFQKSIHLTNRLVLDAKHSLVTAKWQENEYLIILSPQNAQIVDSKIKKDDEHREKLR